MFSSQRQRRGTKSKRVNPVTSVSIYTVLDTRESEREREREAGGVVLARERAESMLPHAQ